MALPPKLTSEQQEQAIKDAREEVMKIARRKGVTLCKAMLRLSNALDAKETKTFLSKKTGEVVYSKPLIANGIRLKAVEIALALHDAMPASKHAVVDKDGIPQDLGGSNLTNLEAATRLAFLIGEAKKRKYGNGGSPKDKRDS